MDYVKKIIKGIFGAFGYDIIKKDIFSYTSLMRLRNNEVSLLKKMLIFRDGTADEAIFNGVFVNNEYEFPISANGWVVIDLGGHIGSFALKCAASGADTIISVEMNPENYRVFKYNTDKIGNIKVLNNAIWCRDGVTMFIKNNKSSQRDTGTFFLSENDNEDDENYVIGSVKTVSLKKIMVDNNIKKIDFLKIDIEGSEVAFFNDLGDELRDIKRIAGEWHGIKTIEIIKNILSKQFVVRFRKTGLQIKGLGECGLFYAVQKS